MNAYMIMAHKNPSQIIRLARTIISGSRGGIVIVHLDSEMSKKDASEVIEFASKNDSRVVLCDERIHGELFERSLIDIVFIMIHAAKTVETEKSIHFDYYILLSGQDYPIKSLEYIEKELETSYPKPYIDCTPYDRNNWVYHKYAVYGKARKYHKWISKNFKRGIIRKLLRVTAIVYAKIVPIFDIDSYGKLQQINVRLFGGSQWWILPDSIIDYIDDEYNKNDKIVDVLLNECIGPDESFIQTMAMRSPLAEMIELNPIEMREQNCKTFAYFTDVDKEFMGHPYILSIKEFNKLKVSDCWFARKFDETVDSNILDSIDKNILGKK